LRRVENAFCDLCEVSVRIAGCIGNFCCRSPVGSGD